MLPAFGESLTLLISLFFSLDVSLATFEFQQQDQIAVLQHAQVGPSLSYVSVA